MNTMELLLRLQNEGIEAIPTDWNRYEIAGLKQTSLDIYTEAGNFNQAESLELTHKGKTQVLLLKDFIKSPLDFIKSIITFDNNLNA